MMLPLPLKLLIAAVLIALALPALAQGPTLTQSHNRFILKFSPQHLLQSGYHFSIEKSLTQSSSQSIIVAPHVYHGNTRFLDNWSDRHKFADDSTAVQGYGTELLHRVYLPVNPKLNAPRLYVAYGASFSTFKVAFNRKSWMEVPDPDGLNYYRNQVVSYTEKINRWGLTAMLGVQDSFLSDNIVMDLYIGLGYKNSKSSSTYGPLQYDKSFLDYGYTGLQPLLGANFGYAF